MKQLLMSVMLVVGAVAATAGQQTTATARAIVEDQFQATVTQIRPRIAIESRITKGAPYSAEAITEFVQVLPDGNRITRKTVTRTFRDSEGRTRREQAALTGSGTEATSISIGDPVAGLSYILEPETRIAYRENHIVALPARVPPGAGATGVVAGADGRGRGALARVAPTPVGREAAETAAAAASKPGIRMAEVRRSGERHTENLGQQMVEGILADGTRTTTVIPAGAIGNAQPITIVSEQWFSPELQILVSTRHSDPRTGETVYRLANIVRGEQDRSLFEVPAEYTVKEPQRRQPMMKFDR